MKKISGLGVVLFCSLFIAGCGGRDISTVESSLNGHWELTDATLNDRPIEEVVTDLEETFGSETSGEVPNAEDLTVETDFYFNEGNLAIINAEGEQTDLIYQVTETNEENNTFTLETPVSNEDVDLIINGQGTFGGEERETFDLTATLTDISITSQTDNQSTSIEQEFEQLGEEFAIQILENIELGMSLSYVDDAAAPATSSE